MNDLRHIGFLQLAFYTSFQRGECCTGRVINCQCQMIKYRNVVGSINNNISIRLTNLIHLFIAYIDNNNNFIYKAP